MEFQALTAKYAEYAKSFRKFVRVFRVVRINLPRRAGQKRGDTEMYHPDRFASEPDKLETYHKLTAAINQAKDAGDIETLREIAEDPHGFILRQGWANR